MYVRLGGSSLFERNICRVKRPLLRKLLTSLAVRYSAFGKKKKKKIDCQFMMQLGVSHSKGSYMIVPNK